MKARCAMLCLILALLLCACGAELNEAPPLEFIPHEVQPLTIVISSRAYHREGEWPQDTTDAVNQLFAELGGLPWPCISMTGLPGTTSIPRRT